MKISSNKREENPLFKDYLIALDRSVKEGPCIMRLLGLRKFYFITIICLMRFLGYSISLVQSLDLNYPKNCCNEISSTQNT